MCNSYFSNRTQTIDNQGNLTVKFLSISNGKGLKAQFNFGLKILLTKNVILTILIKEKVVGGVRGMIPYSRINSPVLYPN